ncbi:MAG: DUF3656 domain-containing protein, partial [Azoarcus sp.]|nr:DUF3656 domain-containing protein [Azoarcus sp.]
DRIFTADSLPADLVPGTSVFRNHDQAFERALEKKSAERRITVDARFFTTANGYALTLTDEDGVTATASIQAAHEAAQHAERALSTIREQIAKLGNTIFTANAITLDVTDAPFLPASALNALRRDAVEQLEAARLQAHARPPRAAPVEPPVPFPDDSLSYLANVLNEKANAFYVKHGVKLIDAAYEANEEHGEVSVMITKHCLRYSFNLCPKEVKGIRPDPMTLVNGKETLTLRFDCKRCEMHVMGELKPHVAKLQAQVAPQKISFHPTRPGAGVTAQ